MKIIFFRPSGASCPGGWIPVIRGGGLIFALVNRNEPILTIRAVGGETKKVQNSFTFREDFYKAWATYTYNFYLMKQLILTGFLFSIVCWKAHAQEEAIVHEGEYGFSLGASHYFGD